MKQAKEPPTSALTDKFAVSDFLFGAMLDMAPIIIPTEPKLANPQSPYEMMMMERWFEIAPLATISFSEE